VDRFADDMLADLSIVGRKSIIDGFSESADVGRARQNWEFF